MSLEDHHPAGTVALAPLRGFLRRARAAAGVSRPVAVRLMDDAGIRALNRQFRGRDAATDVLSFVDSGDIAISLDTAARQALRHGHALEIEIRILLLHGLLHLAGHDHETDHGEMRRLEDRLRARLGLPHSLIARASGRRP